MVFVLSFWEIVFYIDAAYARMYKFFWIFFAVDFGLSVNFVRQFYPISSLETAVHVSRNIGSFFRIVSRKIWLMRSWYHNFFCCIVGKCKKVSQRFWRYLQKMFLVYLNDRMLAFMHFKVLRIYEMLEAVVSQQFLT